MQDLNALPEGLPGAARLALERYISSLGELYGPNLLAVILYGSAARDDYVPGASNLNLLVVLQAARIEQVKKAAAVSRQARDKHGIEPRFMSLLMLKTASDVLPIAFLDMQEDYIVLHGEDVLKDIVIERRNLRYQVEYQLRFLLLRMSNQYLLASQDRDLLASHLNRSFTVFLHLLKSVFRLLGERPPARHGEIIARSAERFGLDRGMMELLLELKRGRRFRQEDVEALFETYVDLLYDVILVVDGIAER